MENFNFTRHPCPISSDLRAVVSQVSHTQKMGKSLTVENIVSFGSGFVVSSNPKKTGRMKEYLQDLVSEGYLDFKNGRYPLTDAGRDLLSCPNTLPDINPCSSVRQRANYGKAMKLTRQAVGTRPKYLS
ncbi:MAG: hypothetical protein ABH840_02415 [Nanoarchaeota archaeon]